VEELLAPPVVERGAGEQRSRGAEERGRGRISSFYNAADTDYADMDETKHSKHFKVFVNSWVRICR